jgi:pyrroline-5-carboxylate reductase
MKIGIIGLGNIGGMLAKRFAEFLSPSSVVIFDINKTKSNKYSQASSTMGVINKSEIIFLCVKPQNLRGLSIKTNLKDKIFVTTVAAIYEKTYYKHFGKIKLFRIIPSMINKVGGPILFHAGKYTDQSDKNKIKRLLSRVGNIHEVNENEIDAYTHLSSCSSAIIAEFIRLYVSTVVKEKNINQEKASEILIEVLEVLIPLLKKDGFGIISQVCTKGGITEQGIKIMNNYQDSFFKELTHSLFKRMDKVRKQYGK